MNTTIGIFLFEGVEELDFVGPYEVFTMTNAVLKHAGEAGALNVMLISEDGQDVQCAKGMRVGVDSPIADVNQLDILLIPGGRGTRDLVNNDAVISWIETIAPNCVWVTSVCSGAFVLAKAGLTEGKKVTTHWAAFDEFEKLGLPGKLMPNVRYVQDGNIVTSAGVSAGIDMALWLTGQVFTPTLARGVQRAMEYDPAPPYQDED